MTILFRHRKSTTYEDIYHESKEELMLTREGSNVRAVYNTNKHDQIRIRSPTDHFSGCIMNLIYVDTNCKQKMICDTGNEFLV